MNTLSDEWAEFRRVVVPADASEAQVKDMRAAFYAGALTMTVAYASLLYASDNDIETPEGWVAELEEVLGVPFRKDFLTPNRA